MRILKATKRKTNGSTVYYFPQDKIRYAKLHSTIENDPQSNMRTVDIQRIDISGVHLDRAIYELEWIDEEQYMSELINPPKALPKPSMN